MKRAIGIIRVSEIGDRDLDRLHTTKVQRDIIERDCARLGLQLTQTMEELDVSGGAPLDKRPALKVALEQVELGFAEAIVFAYRDRMDRSIEHGGELIRRMDAKGALLIAGGKQVTHATHDGWRTATLESFLNEDQRRAVGAKLRDVHKRVVAAGVCPLKHVPRGYRKRPDSTIEVDPTEGPIIREAWRRRAQGASVPEVRRWLVSQGVQISADSVVSRMFRNRFYLGELHYRTDIIEPNLHSHEPLVTPELWDEVQRRAGTLGGRRTKSPKLLARQGILVCANCGGRMSQSSKEQRRSPFYRCTNPDCPERPAIVCSMLDPLVIDRTKELTSALHGRASAKGHVQEAKAAWDQAEAALTRLLRLLTAADAQDEAEAVEQVRAAREARNAAKAAYDKALAQDDALRVVVTATDVFEIGTLDEQRALVRAVIDRITVAPGKGIARVAIFPKV